MFGTSCVWLGFSCGISVPNPPPSFPAWICQNANHQSGSGSTAPLYLHQVGRSAHTLTHTLAAPLTAGQMQDGVCLQAQDWDLTSSEGALRPSRSYLLPAWAPSSWWHFLPSSPLPPPPGGPGEQFPLSRDPALGSLPSRVHGLSTPTPPHPAVLTPHNPTFAFCRRWFCPKKGGQWSLLGISWEADKLLFRGSFLFPQPSHLPQCRNQRGEKGERVMSAPLSGLALNLCSEPGEGGGAVKGLGALWEPWAGPVHRLSSTLLHKVPNLCKQHT